MTGQDIRVLACLPSGMQKVRQVRHAGFTLVELILVIVLVGILSAVAMGGFAGNAVFSANAHSQQVKTVYRFAQKLAVAQNRPIYVSTSSARVALCHDAACSLMVPAPGGNSGSEHTLTACDGNPLWYCEGVPPGVSLATAPAALMFFNAQGRPFAGQDDPASDNSTFATLTLTLTAGDSTETVTVERETGYVH